MTFPASSFAGPAASFANLPVGAVVQSPINLEKLSNGQWLALDGRDMIRGSVPSAFAQMFPVGVFSSTARTLADTPIMAVIGAGSSNFVAAASAGAAAIQYSTDGASWSKTSVVTPASTQVNSLIWAGSRWVAGVSVSAQPIVTTADNPNSTWTVCSGGTTTTLTQGLAYSPTNALTLLVPNASGNTVYTLADGSTTWSSNTTASTQAKQAVVWTGQKFVILVVPTSNGILIQTSATGTGGWADQYIDWYGMASASTYMASDGSGTVVISNGNIVSSASALLVSKDHGATWRKIIVSSEAACQLNGSAAGLSYANGRFIFGINNGPSVVSGDGLSWFVEPVTYRGMGGLSFAAVTYKGGVYAGMTTSTAAFTATEDMSRFRLPGAFRVGVGSQPVFGAPSYQEYIRVY